MLAVARERHPAHSVGRIGLLSSPHPPGGGGEGLGERGNEQGFETSAISSRKAFAWFLDRQPLQDLRKQLSKMSQCHSPKGMAFS